MNAEMSRSLLFQAYDILPDYIIGLDAKKNINYLNPALIELLGGALKLNTVGSVHSLFNGFQDIDLTEMKSNEILEFKSEVLVMDPFLSVDIKLRKIALIGEEDLFLAVINPLTIKLINNHFAEAENHYFKQLLESIPFGIVVLNEHDQVIDANSGFLKLFNYRTEQIRHSFINDLIVPEELKSEGSILTERVYAGNEIFKETKRRTSDGKVIDVSVTGIPIVTASGQKQVFGIYQDITANLEIRKQLEQEKLYFQTLFKELPFGVILMNDREELVDCNDNFLSMFQYSKAELSQPNGFDLIFPAGMEPEGSQLRKQVLNGASIYKETIRKRKDGQLIPIAITANLVRLLDGSVMVFGFYQNISERRILENALAEQQRELSAMVRFLPGMMYRCDASRDYNITFASFGSIRVTGYDPEIFTEGKRTFDSVILPEFKEMLWSRWQEVIANNIDFEAEYQILAANGTKRWVWERGRPVYDDKGEVLFLEGYIEDITDRRQMQDNLKRERDLLQSLMDNIPDTIYFKDLKSRFIRVNKAQAATLGLKDPVEAIGGTDADFFDNEHAEAAYEDEQKLMKSGISLVSKQEYIKTSRGWRWFTASKVPLRDITGKIIGLAGVSRDITDIKNLEEQLLDKEANLRRSNQEKDKLFSVIAHDLRSPFNSFLLLTEILAEDSYGFDPAELKNLATSMHRAAKSVAELLENLLSWSSIQRGTLKYSPDYYKLDELIQRNLNYYQAQIQSKSLMTKVFVESKILLYTDQHMFSTVLRNLISNAIKFTPHEGRIEIRATQNEGWIGVEVIDSGIGMTDQMQQQLFVVENKGRKGTDGEPSSGLGLILVREFVERMGGNISINSKVGEGSVFRFNIPVEKP